MPTLKYEKTFFKKGYKTIGGVDEAGRGPLAGPVVVACVALTPDFIYKKEFKAIKNSKLLTEKTRALLYELITNNLPFGIGISDHKIIDKLNIYHATYLTMKKAVENIKLEPDFIYVDGPRIIPNIQIKQQAVVDGDNLVFSIAAASIIAKVTRDEIMRKLHELHPEYGFTNHKGYGTREHLEALKKYGPCPYHRFSFSPVKLFTYPPPPG